jgi:hypothetical protein
MLKTLTHPIIVHSLSSGSFLSEKTVFNFVRTEDSASQYRRLKNYHFLKLAISISNFFQ